LVKKTYLDRAHRDLDVDLYLEMNLFGQMEAINIFSNIK